MDGSFLNASKMSHGGNVDDNRVDGYKRLVRVFPFAAFMVIWQCAFAQTDINFQSITQQCDLRLDTSDPDSNQVPAAMLGVLEPIVVVLCIPILDSIVYPFYTSKVGKAPSQFGKVVAGLILATVGIYWTGVFEVFRRNSGALVGPDGGPILDYGSDQPMNKMYWAGAIPNYVLMALAECLINVTAYEVFYMAVPLSLKSTAQATNLLMVCMGSILTSVFTIAFRTYLPTDNLNDGNLEYMFYAVGSLSVVNVIAFALVMKKINFGFASSPENSEYILVASDSVPEHFYGKTTA
jgi:peptide/histidine transporter 3/4